MSHGRVAMQNLQQEQRHGVGWIEQPITPDMTDLGKTSVDSLGPAKRPQGVRFDPLQRGRDDSHPWPPLSLGT